jgi:hypothetical protein
MRHVFEPVWISSVERLERFADVLSRWRRWKMPLGFSAPMDKDFPQVRSWTGFRFSRVPLVMVAAGNLEIDDGALHFESASPPRRRLLTWLNLASDLEFELPAAAITSVERHSQPGTAIAKYYLHNWVRVKSSTPVMMGDFLMLVGNYGLTVGSIKRGTDDLYQALIDLRASAGSRVA